MACKWHRGDCGAYATIKHAMNLSMEEMNKARNLSLQLALQKKPELTAYTAKMLVCKRNLSLQLTKET